jgi:hypothetical protein
MFPPAGVDEVLPMILIILIAPRQCHTLRAIVRLASYACNMGEMRAPLPARHAVCPLCSYQDSRVVDWIVLSCDWSKVVRGDGDKDAAAAGIGEAGLLCSLGREGLHREDYMGLSFAARRVQKDVGAERVIDRQHIKRACRNSANLENTKQIEGPLMKRMRQSQPALPCSSLRLIKSR